WGLAWLVRLACRGRGCGAVCCAEIVRWNTFVPCAIVTVASPGSLLTAGLDCGENCRASAGRGGGSVGHVRVVSSRGKCLVRRSPRVLEDCQAAFSFFRPPFGPFSNAERVLECGRLSKRSWRSSCGWVLRVNTSSVFIEKVTKQVSFLQSPTFLAMCSLAHSISRA
ncbi:unnamed protein product, partial [Scytosiphon promiscuus]